MADETAVQTSCIQENAEADEFRENIPPGGTAAAETSKLQVQGDLAGYSSADPGGENKPLSENCTFSTPAPVSISGGARAKSRMSGLQSALTPILKYLNIGNKCPSPEPLKCGNSPHLSVPFFPFGVTTASCKKSTGGSSQHPNSNPSSSHSGRSLGDKNSPVYWLQDECLPEITLLDCTSDSTMQITSTEGNTSDIQPPKLSKHNGTTAGTDQNDKMVDTPDRKGQRERWLDDRYFPEITLLDVTSDSELSPAADMSPMEVREDVPPVDAVKPNRPSSELSGLIVAEPDGPVMMQSEELSSTLTGGVTNTTSSFSEQSKSVQENVKSSLEATRDISVGSVLENNTSSELSGQNMKSQTSAEDTLGILPSNVTHDMSSSSNMSVQSAASQIATSDVQSNTSSKNVTIEIHAKPVETSIAVEANEEELLTSRDTESTGKEPQTSSDLSASTNLNTTDQTSCPQNKTLDLPPSNVNSPKTESVAADQVSADVQSTTETSLDTNQNSSAAKSGESCDVQNGTFSILSLRKSCGTSDLGKSVQNNTFESKPNGTITITETSSSDSPQNTFDKPSPSKVCNPTIDSKDTSDVHTPEVSKQNGTASTDPDVKMADTPENTFEVNPAVAVAPAASRCETKDHSHSLPDGLSESLGHQGTDTENNQANTFNLDDSLDLKVDSLVTSTPMTHCKVFHFSSEHDKGKAIAAQKKLYGDRPGKPVVQVPPDVPSNLITDRKTLMQPAARSHLPPLKAASQLFKYNPTSALPGRCEPATSRLPMTRQRTQTEAVKNSAPSAQGITGISSSYNLRATTTASKQPNSGLPRPPMSSIPSGFQRSAPGLRPPSAKSNVGPAAANPGMKFTQPKKHPLTRGELLPTAKRKKTDGPYPSSGAETSTASDAVNGFKNPKRPGTSCNQRVLPAKAQRDDAAVPVSAAAAENMTSCNAASRSRNQKTPVNHHRSQPAKPQGHGCAKCVVLEEQLKTQSAEIKRLKEELLSTVNKEKNAECAN
ncbi:uncharacterized protein si:ch211-126c2.4 [Hippoglossus hippoglossus]|uniref:uncharacterized protein si:ch211-126c2.4 n=1 Tax=Hippoglossus hippoglossus TaxID=8267 RepID=UPI00148C13BE|nr:uncharacterized protein si:ch211-126c2.4 [Hippoglossus hippoglossus]